jgi:uncharacterized membrane protein
MNELLDMINHPFIAGILIGFGVAILAMLGVWWIDKIVYYHWRGRRR